MWLLKIYCGVYTYTFNSSKVLIFTDLAVSISLLFSILITLFDFVILSTNVSERFKADLRSIKYSLFKCMELKISL